MIKQELYLGKVKFFDSTKGFGFIRDLSSMNEYFIHAIHIKTIPIIEDDLVVFQLKESRTTKSKFDASNVVKLETYTLNPDFLILKFYEQDDVYIKRNILKALPSYCSELIFENETNNIISNSNTLDYESFYDKLFWLFTLFEKIIEQKRIVETIFHNKELEEFWVKLWINKTISIEPDIEQISSYFKKSDSVIKAIIYEKLTLKSKLDLYETFMLIDNLPATIKGFISFIYFEKKIEIQSNYLKILKSKLGNLNFNLEQSLQAYILIKPYFFFNNENFGKALILLVYSVVCDLVKLKIWLNSEINDSKFVSFHTSFIFLNAEEQQKYIKKCFFLLSIGEQGITLESILELKNLTFRFSDGILYKLDFSCNILLSAIESLRNGSFLNEETIFSIITNHVEKDTSTLLSLSGFFEKCDGRFIPDKIEISKDGRESIKSLKKITKPINVEFCEGVSFGEDGKDRKYGHDCWWCRGNGCYQSNQINELPKEFSDFTLKSFIKIVKLHFQEKDYLDFLALLNKINVYLKHLNCRTCGHILKPYENGYYSYYRVSNFICSNANCKDKENIYLNHCLGAKKTVIKSRCYNLIDSRDVKRCNYLKDDPTNNYEKYGPYVCNQCGSCCSQKSLAKKYDTLIERKWNIQPGLEWKVKNKVGHLERSLIFCYNCGTEMVDSDQQYNEFIEKLENPDNSFRVINKGKNNRGFWYMVQASYEFFKKAEGVGLKIEDTNRNQVDVKFISEGNNNILSCKMCNINYNKTIFEFIPQVEKPTIE